MERREFIAMLASTPAVTVPGAADDQAAAPAAAPKPLSITLLGTGTPSPSLDRQSSGRRREHALERVACYAGAGLVAAVKHHVR